MIAALESVVGPGIASRAARLARHGRRRARSGCGRRASACAIRRRGAGDDAGEHPREQLLGQVTADRLADIARGG